jgi:hypothetical protein
MTPIHDRLNTAEKLAAFERQTSRIDWLIIAAVAAVLFLMSNCGG